MHCWHFDVQLLPRLHRDCGHAWLRVWLLLSGHPLILGSGKGSLVIGDTCVDDHPRTPRFLGSSNNHFVAKLCPRYQISFPVRKNDRQIGKSSVSTEREKESAEASQVPYGAISQKNASCRNLQKTLPKASYAVPFRGQ